MAITEARPPGLAPEPSRPARLLAWLTTTDHKKIGILYFYNSFAVFAIAGIFALVIFPMLAGFGNYFVPLQIGALDMAFPRVNALSFWLLPVSALTILSGFLAKGGAAASGWTTSS